MTGLNHHFLLFDRRVIDYWDYMKVINHKDAISIHDDLLGYMADSLMWVQCHNPAYGKQEGLIPHHGLNFYGPTVIKKDGALALSQIFDAWALLFSSGPPRLELTGDAGITGASFEYQKVVANRDEFVESLNKVATYGRQVAESLDELYVMHLGI